jgi:outer membrane protein OmpA-like peptidoglycan-associated protein
VAIELTWRLYHSALFALAIVLASAFAQAATGIDHVALDRYDPAAPGDALLWVPDASIDGNAELAAGARLSYARSPLVLKTADGSERIVTHQLIAHALLAAELARRFELSLDAPFVLSQAGAASDRFESPSGTAIGDLRLGARAQLVAARGALPAGALELELWLPTGDGGYASFPSARYGTAAIIGADLDDWLWRARLGVRYRRDETEAAGLFGSEAHAALGVGVRFGRALFGLELTGATGVEADAWFADNTTGLEALVSAKYHFGWITPLIAAGPGLSIGAGTPAYRVIAGLEIAHELAPHWRPRAALSDRDGDGVRDPDDACPDRIGKVRGCPADADRDRIFDADDACPSAAGPKSADPKRHGCPREDGSAARAQAFASHIAIREQVRFETGKDALLPESFEVLGDVAKLLSAHPEIARVSVDGHTDDVGDDATNLTLSRRRALAVVRWLVAHGIDERRLEARGFGARQPLVGGTSEQARSKNRRVEFWIKRRSALGRRGWRDGAAR